jgi:hypothetical protein
MGDTINQKYTGIMHRENKHFGRNNQKAKTNKYVSYKNKK